MNAVDLCIRMCINVFLWILKIAASHHAVVWIKALWSSSSPARSYNSSTRKPFKSICPTRGKIVWWKSHTAKNKSVAALYFNWKVISFELHIQYRGRFFGSSLEHLQFWNGSRTFCCRWTKAERVGGGSIAQWLAYLLPDPAAPGLITSVSKNVSEEKIVDIAEVNQWRCSEESG